MSGAVNPWLTSAVEAEPETSPSLVTSELCPPTGPTQPQHHGVPEPVLRLPVAVRSVWPGLWWVGAHGGAGESTLASVMPGSMEAGHAWPQVSDGSTAPVVLVARTSMRGLLAAQGAITQWASGLVRGVSFLGLVFSADAPGRLPKPLRDLAYVIGGGAPRVWSIPWVPSWRMAEPTPDNLPREALRLVDDLHSLINSNERHKDEYRHVRNPGAR